MKTKTNRLLTIIAILATNLFTGVSIGLLISVYFIVRNNFKAEYKVISTVDVSAVR